MKLYKIQPPYGFRIKGRKSVTLDGLRELFIGLAELPKEVVREIMSSSYKELKKNFRANGFEVRIVKKH